MKTSDIKEAQKNEIAAKQLREGVLAARIYIRVSKIISFQTYDPNTLRKLLRNHHIVKSHQGHY